jgi:predicted nucleic acid-binding protein
MKIFIDSDVLLDAGLEREPFCQAACQLLDHLESHPQQGFMAWHSVANIFYLFSKAATKEEAKSFILDLCHFIQVVPTGTNDVFIAANLPITDFEDALQCAAAMACEATVIVSRNVKDYQNSPIRAVTPEQMWQELRIESI